MKKQEIKFWQTFYKIRYLHSITDKQTKNEVDFLKEFLPIKKYKNILDFICGFGRHSIELAKIGYEVEGFDVDNESVRKAKSRIKVLRLKNINLYVKDALKFRGQNFFDAAICLYSSIGFLEERQNEKVFKNLFDSVKNGGRIILDLMNCDYAIKHLIPYAEKTVIYKGRSYFIKHKRKILSNPLREKNSIEFLVGNKKSRASYALRLYSLEELRNKIQENGFRIFEKFGSFQKDKLSPNYQRIIIIADKI